MKRMKDVSKGMREAMERRDRDKGEYRGVRMLRTRVPFLDDDKVDGYYLGMDMGGSNFRISVIHASMNSNERKCKIVEAMKWKIPDSAKNESIFNWAAQRIQEALVTFQKYNLCKINCEFLIGFTFSFPVKQEELHEGILLQWNKSFNAPSLIGKDIARELERECLGLGLKVRIGSVINDSVATLLTGMFLHEGCKLAVILGSGTNACLVHSSGDLVNTEWAAYGEHRDSLPIEEFDKIFDSTCETGRQYFEKMTSGLYLPRLYSLITKKECASAKDLGELEAAGDRTARMLTDRSVQLIAAGIRGALEYIGVDEQSAVVVIDGSMYEKYFEYKERLQAALPYVKFIIGKDYSSIGNIIPLLSNS